MPYKENDWCCPSKQCCKGNMDRRSFLKTGAAAAGTLGIAGKARAQKRTAEEEQADLEAWTKALWDKGQRRIYRGEELAHIAFPLGGVGAGQLFLTGHGHLDKWQILNNFNSEAHAPGAHFGIWAQAAGEAPQARLLQQGDTGAIPGMGALAFSGEYPFAWIDYEDGAGTLPVRVRLEAFSPMIPLNEQDSGLPAAVFTFKVTNPGAQAVEAAVLATVPNLVGWDGYEPIQGPAFAEFGGNLNETAVHGGATHVAMTAQRGAAHTLSQPCALSTTLPDAAWHMRLCGGVTVHLGNPLPRLPDRKGVYWLGPVEAAPGRDLLDAIEDVSQGAALILSGAEGAAFLSGARSSRRKNTSGAEVFENWEDGDYSGWDVEGDAFGPAPAAGTLAGQNKVSGFRGARLVNTFFQGDGTVGRARSKPFTITHDYVHMLVGGGNHPEETCINLIVNGEIAATATGKNDEKLTPVRWDIGQYRGKRAHFEIVDTHTGGWGHINVDDIAFSDSPVAPSVPRRFIKAVRDVLPFTWKHADLKDGAKAGDWTPHAALNEPLRIGKYWRIEDFKLRQNAETLLAAEDGTPLVVKGRYGKGTVLFVNGDPRTWADGYRRRLVVGGLLATVLEAEYTAAEGLPPDHPHFGSMALTAFGGEVQTGDWDDLAQFWPGFAQQGGAGETNNTPTPPGRTRFAAATRRLQLAPGESREATFVLSWHFPNRTRTRHYGWGPPPLQYDHRLGNQYNHRFDSALAVARYVAAHRERLETETRLFHDTFYDSTLPHWLLDCITANASITRSPIYVWLEDGTAGGFEGTDNCCPMNCTHVYNYAMSMGYLFPALERNVRETDLLHQMHPEKHFIPHRTVLPLELPRLGNEIGGPHHHALDGELGTVLKTYREWRMCGERAWLKTLWPKVKLVMRHVMRDHDTEGDGVILGEQPNTYDTHLFGSNTFIGTLYLAALRATEEMAKVLHDDGFAAQCRQRFASGSKGYDERCWNGEFYINNYDAPGEKPETYNNRNCYGPGCHVDQVLGQWWANLLGLGYVLPAERVRAAARAIHKHNWRLNFFDHVQTPRRFANDDEKGLLTCTWPKGGRPEVPILYCDEIWTGLEYHVAATLLHEGFVEEAFQIVKGARDRYQGYQRNPWSEIECGGHYARAMASWSLLHAAAGYHYDASSGALALAPRVNPDDYRGFFTTAHAWGRLAMKRRGNERIAEVAVVWGELGVAELRLAASSPDDAAKTVAVTGGPVFEAAPGASEVVIAFRDAQQLVPGKTLRVQYQA